MKPSAKFNKPVIGTAVTGLELYDHNGNILNNGSGELEIIDIIESHGIKHFVCNEWLNEEKPYIIAEPSVIEFKPVR